MNELAAASHPKADEPLGVVVPCLSGFRVRDLPEGIVSDMDSVFTHLLYSIIKRLPHAAAVAANTMRGLDPAIDAELASAFEKYLPVGPFFSLLSPQHALTDGNEECAAWLDRQVPSSVAYVSFGTFAPLPPSELAELAFGLEASGMPFLWSIKNKESLPDGFLDRVRGKGSSLVLDWVPQARVLAHNAVGVFVTHCGWNSVTEAMAYGVPMICRPVLADQLMLGKVICGAWNIGLGFADGTVTREELVTALSKILGAGEDEEGRMIRERCCEMKARVLREVAPGGSTSNNLNSLLEIVKA